MSLTRSNLEFAAKRVSVVRRISAILPSRGGGESIGGGACEAINDRIEERRDRRMELESERESICAVTCCARELSFGRSIYECSSSTMTEAWISTASREGRVVLLGNKESVHE